MGVLIGVVSFERNLLQVVDPSFTGAQPWGVSNPSAHVASEAFSLACGLSSTYAFALRPRRTDARRSLPLRRVLPLAT